MPDKNCKRLLFEIGLFYATFMNLMHASVELEDIPKAMESFRLGKDLVEAFFPTSNKLDMIGLLDIKMESVYSFVVLGLISSGH